VIEIRLNEKGILISNIDKIKFESTFNVNVKVSKTCFVISKENKLLYNTV
jgi:hypothetical protein